MKKICHVSIMVTLIVLVSTPLLLIAHAENIGPKSIELKMGKRVISFTHRKHQKLANNQCWECHDKNKGKIEGWGEATAHKLCIPCHDLNEKGPISCKECHEK